MMHMKIYMYNGFWQFMIYICCILASPVCLNFIAGSRWLVVGLENGTVMVSLFTVLFISCVNYAYVFLMLVYVSQRLVQWLDAFDTWLLRKIFLIPIP